MKTMMIRRPGDNIESVCCAFCKLGDNNPDKYGEMITSDELTVHYFCLLLSGGVYQRGDEHDGIYGFLLEDIEQEVRRASRLRCTGCKKTGASICCCVGKCRKTVHFPCAVKLQFIFQFTGTFPAYCKQHSPRQLVSCDVSLPQSCSVCLDSLEPLLSYNVLKCPCCLNSWFHRDCIQRQALSAGLFLFRCTLCNNKEQFQQEMLRMGIHIPERDASWELEKNAYGELLQVYQRCDARKCVSRKGRNASTKSGWSQILRCETCGSRGTHRKCSSLEIHTSTWACEDCSAAVQGQASPPSPRLLDTHQSGGQRKGLKRRLLNPSHKERAVTMNGRVIPHTPLAVDFWQVRKCPHVRLFFLSHMHSDHTAGLTSTWSNRPIYCSPVTATLLKLKLQVKEQWIHPLELGEPYLLPLDDIGKERMTVTLMDANHCPGAVMFLFQGYFGTVLYTGDFRYTPSMLRESCLRTNTTIDVLYLDNTNCDPTRTLPSREQATQQIKEIIRQNPGHKVVIGLYTLGKESLLVNLAVEFKTWVEVSHERLETLRALELPDVFTTEPGAGRIRAVDQAQVRRANLALWNREQPTLAILPTSRPRVSSLHPGIHVVPYSDHSSHQELVDFVSALQPTSLMPIVGACGPSFSALLPRRKRHEVLVPESVRKYMAAPRPEVQAPAPAGLRRPHGRPYRSAPRGVVFESPGRSSRHSSVDCAWETGSLEEEEEEEAEIDEGSDCTLMDPTNERTPPRERVGAGDHLWNLDLAQRVPEEMELRATQEMEMMGSLPFTQSNFAPMEIQSNTVASLKPKPRGLTDPQRLPRDGAAAALSRATASDDFSRRAGIQDEEEDDEAAPSRTSSGDDGATAPTVTPGLGHARSRLTEECEEALLLQLPLSEEDMSDCRAAVHDNSLVKHRLAPYFVGTGNGALCC